jgi:hypothetical protein
MDAYKTVASEWPPGVMNFRCRENASYHLLFKNVPVLSYRQN